VRPITRFACVGAALGLLALGAAGRALAARDELQRIVQRQCLPNWLRRHDPAPCLAVRPAGPHPAAAMAADYALLADRKGGAHFLLIPLRTLRGIGSPALLRADAPNYFAAAWDARSRLGRGTLRPVPADEVGLAVNSRYSRGQDQLHIHIECQSAALHAALGAARSRLTANWMPLALLGHTYQVRRVMGRSLQHANPLRLLAEGLPAARTHMALYTLVVAGMQFQDGPGFALLTRRAFLRGGERLLDDTCAIAAQSPLRRETGT